MTEVEDYWGVGNKSVADITKDYLRQAIQQKSKEPLIKCKKFLSEQSLPTLMKLLKDEEIKKLLLTIDQKTLPAIDPSYQPYGAPITASKIRKIMEEHF